MKWSPTAWDGCCYLSQVKTFLTVRVKSSCWWWVCCSQLVVFETWTHKLSSSFLSNTVSPSLSEDRGRFTHPSLFWDWPRGVSFRPVVVLRLRTSGPSDRPPPPCVCDTLRTADASIKDLCGAIASAHRLAGGSDCRPAAANHSDLLRWHKDVSANQVLHCTCGLWAVPEWDELQLRGGDVLRLAGEPEECS